MATLTSAPDVKALLDDGVKTFFVYDFDGVFNAEYISGTFSKDYFNPNHMDRHPNPEWNDNSRFLRRDVRPPKNYVLHWSDDLVNFSNDMTARDDSAVIWLTTWREHMGDVIDRLGLTSYRTPHYLPWGDGLLGHHHKLDAFANYFADVSDARLVWVDDVILTPDHIRDFGDPSTMFADSDKLLIAPDARYGISCNDAKAINNFVNELD